MLRIKRGVMRNLKKIFACLMIVSFIAIANVQFVCAATTATGGVYVSPPQQQPSGGCQANSGGQCQSNGSLCTTNGKSGKCTTHFTVTPSSTTYTCDCVYDPLLLPITP